MQNSVIILLEKLVEQEVLKCEFGGSLDYRYGFQDGIYGVLIELFGELKDQNWSRVVENVVKNNLYNLCRHVKENNLSAIDYTKVKLQVSDAVREYLTKNPIKCLRKSE